MKKLIKLCLLCVFAISCENELNVPLSALTADDVTPNAAFAETLVVGAYAALNSNNWGGGESNWILGSVSSDDAFKGSEAGDQKQSTQFELYDAIPENSLLDNKWRRLYEGVSRVNSAINTVAGGVESGDIAPNVGNAFLGELYFLRAHLHFDAKKNFGNIPYIDENTTEAPDNTIDAWPMIEADFEFAIANLPEVHSTVGRVGSWAAKAYLAKIHMYQLDYAAAKPLLDDVINNGPYALNASFHDNFNAATNNSIESIFAVQYAINDGAGAGQQNANYADTLNFPHSASPFGCCGFHQPSHDLVNAYLVDANGLPFVGAPISDPAEYVKSVDPNDTPGGSARHADDDSFVPETRNLDPRLDWSVGRKGIPFLGWGDYPGLLWVRDAVNGGPYMSKKHVWEKSQNGTGGQSGNWGQQLTAVNTNILRFAEILLLRAEVSASEGDLAGAATLVDRVRARAANPEFFVKRDDDSDAANYMVGLYADNGGFPNQAFAEDAVFYEHRLEMALEGHRFYDVVRRSKAAEVFNGYTSRPQFRGYLTGSTFTEGKGIYPIPQSILDLSGGAFKQNPTY